MEPRDAVPDAALETTREAELCDMVTPAPALLSRGVLWVQMGCVSQLELEQDFSGCLPLTILHTVLLRSTHHIDPPRIMLKCRFRTSSSGLGLRACISHKLPVNVNTASLQITLCWTGSCQHVS
jgi:hypothetical protein